VGRASAPVGVGAVWLARWKRKMAESRVRAGVSGGPTRAVGRAAAQRRDSPGCAGGGSAHTSFGHIGYFCRR